MTTMPADVRSWVGEALAEIAPDARLDAVADADPLAEVLDLDSMDSLRLLERLSALAGVAIPDRDASRLRTLGDITAYLIRRRDGAGAAVQ